MPLPQPVSPRITRRRMLGLSAGALAALAVGCASSLPIAEVRRILSTLFTRQGDDWRSDVDPGQTADRLEARVSPRDRLSEGGNVFLRGGDWAIAITPSETGSRIELDAYQRIRNRYVGFIGGFWGVRPGSYGPRGDGGGFRGGGFGSGK